MNLYLIRHGESVGNRHEDIDMPDSPLTDIGTRQAERVTSHLSGIALTRIVASPLVRALQTAQPLAVQLGLRIEVWRELVEVRNGCDYTGPARSELDRKFPQAIFPYDMEPDGWTYKGGDDSGSIQARVHAVIQRLQRLDPNDSVAVFAHGHLNAVLISELLRRSGISQAEQPAFPIRQANGAINHFLIKEGIVLQYSLNQTAHL